MEDRRVHIATGRRIVDHRLGRIEVGRQVAQAHRGSVLASHRALRAAPMVVMVPVVVGVEDTGNLLRVTADGRHM